MRLRHNLTKNTYKTSRTHLLEERPDELNVQIFAIQAMHRL